MKHLKLFQTNADYESATLDLPNVSYVEETGSVWFNPVDPFNGYEYVDLGLPSGTLWAKCNVGATSPEEIGLYFAWGEVIGYKDINSGKSFSWEDYKYCNGSYDTLTKYCSSSLVGVVDDKTTLDLEDDAASVNMGGEWRMPNPYEHEELINNTTSTWTTINGINGRLFTSNINGNTIFLPAGGACMSGERLLFGETGCYITSYRDANGLNTVGSFFNSENNLTLNLDNERFMGLPVRGVIKPNN